MTMRSKGVEVRGVLVDSGSEFTWLHRSLLEQIKIKIDKKDRTFTMANGGRITRRLGYAIARATGEETVDEVVFGEEGDLNLLGARSLDGLNLRIDPAGKRLVVAGPILAAAEVAADLGNADPTA